VVGADGLLCFRDRVYVLMIRAMSRITSQNHDTRVAGHPGTRKTLELVSRNYWWPRWSRYIGQYVKTVTLASD